MPKHITERRSPPIMPAARGAPRAAGRSEACMKHGWLGAILSFKVKVLS
jgi:hypothetical protein